MTRVDDLAAKVADLLLQIKAIEVRTSHPFQWSSGWLSPIYCDNRKILSYPRVRTFIRQRFVASILQELGKPDMIAGVATGGIPHGVLVAQELGVGFAYVRSKPKEHGTHKMIEGTLERGQSVVLIEDLISTGQSSLNAVKALRKEGCEVEGLASIFHYGFNEAVENFQKARCRVITLADYDTLLQKGLEEEYIREEQLKTLQDWRKAPESWGKNDPIS